MNIEHLRHSLAHLLAAAVLELYPDAKPTIGPAIDNGFYYDFEFSAPISVDDLSAIEKKMKHILKSWHTFDGQPVSADEARAKFAGNPYKLELIDEIVEKGEAITLYTSGAFTDLCRGGHLESAREIKADAFKLDRVAGAYWRGDEQNTMLTRIYGLAFETRDELDAYLTQRAEAEARDHRKLGKELDLFFIDDMVGKGLIMWLPKGTLIRQEIERLVHEKESAGGYHAVVTPHIAREELFLTSGHLPYYKDGMYPAMEMDDGTYYLRAMNCPHHHRVYLHQPHSYRDLPLRLAEYGTVYRNELSGTLAGLLRVRGLAMNDAHIYCRQDQIKDEFKSVLALTKEYFEIFGLENYWFRLSKWSPEHTDKYIDQPENWETTQNIIREVLQELDLPFKEADDEAAFYGPKVDVQFTSAIGREETMSTIQLDFLARERFGLNYIDESGKENNEVFVIHRAPLSTHERFMAFLIEHYAGAFPTWLAPVQAVIIPVSEKFADYAESVRAQLTSANIRVEIDADNETLGKRIRNAEKQKVPYILVVGEKEVAENKVAVRKRGEGDLGAQSITEFAALISEEIKARKA